MSDKGSTFSIREEDLYCQLLGRILLTIIFCIGLIIGSTLLLALLAPQVGEPIYFILVLFFFLMIPIRIVGSIISCIEKTKGFIFDIENGTFSYYQEEDKLFYPLSKRSVINLSEIESLATKNVVHRGTDDKGHVKKNYFYILYIYGNMPTVSLEFGDEEVRVEVERALVKYSAASSRVKRMKTESF